MMLYIPYESVLDNIEDEDSPWGPDCDFLSFADELDSDAEAEVRLQSGGALQSTHINREHAQQIVDHLTRVFALDNQTAPHSDPLKFEKDQRGREVLRTPSGYEIGGAGDNIIGLSRTLALSEGYDSRIITPGEDDPEWIDHDVTARDCIAIADHMLARWQKFREKHAALVAAATEKKA